MRISDWSSDVCSSDLREHAPRHGSVERTGGQRERSECGVGEATFVDDAREHRESGERDARAHEQSRAALTQSFGEEAGNVEQEGRNQRSKQEGRDNARRRYAHRALRLRLKMVEAERGADEEHVEPEDRKSAGEGKSVAGRVNLGGGGNSKK